MLLASITILTAATYTDCTARSIPNFLTVAAAAFGISFQLLTSSGIAGFLFSVSGILVGGLLLCLPYYKGLVGGGDVKLLAALGAWVGPKIIFTVFLYSTICGGLLAVAHLLHRQGNPLFSAFSFIVQHNRAGGVNLTRGLPYAVAISGGFLTFMVWGELL